MAVIEFPTKTVAPEPFGARTGRFLQGFSSDVIRDLREMFLRDAPLSAATDKVGQASVRVAALGFALGSAGALIVSFFVN